MTTFFHAIEGVLVIASSFFLAQFLEWRGVDEGRAKFWVSVFIVVIGGCIIWIHRRGKHPA